MRAGGEEKRRGAHLERLRDRGLVGLDRRARRGGILSRPPRVGGGFFARERGGAGREEGRGESGHVERACAVGAFKKRTTRTCASRGRVAVRARLGE
eukprot:29098-Pelagococcus_subviridis.AAC.1